jgi:Fe-S cluster biogenesis protein NfuA
MTQVEAMLREAQQGTDPRTQARITALVQGLLEMHAAAIERILAGIGDSATIDRLAQDDLVGSVLLLYGLHPLDLETRVRQALEQARPLLRAHGGNVELVSLTDGVVRLKLLGSCHNCSSSDLTLKSAIEDALLARAPDVAGIELDQTAASPAPTEGGLPRRVGLPLVNA